MNDEDEEPTGETLSFREYLDQLIREGLDAPQFFAGEDG